MHKIGPVFLTALFFCCSSLWGGTYSFYGITDKDAISYRANEKMIFRIQLLEDEEPVDGIDLIWTRTGEDGKTEKGKAVSSSEKPLEITSSIDRPGFVRIRVEAKDSSGKPILDSQGARLSFDGTAGADIEKIQSFPEPADFDAFWDRQKAKLAKVPMKVKMVSVPSSDPKVECFNIKVDCAGGMPVSGYFAKPKNAKPKSLPIHISFHGAGVRSANKPIGSGRNHLALDINAHGLENGLPDEYYKKLDQTTLHRYGRLRAEDNADPENCVWYGMVLRLIRALEFMKSQPEWDGKNLAVSGGSQGGFQSLVAAGLDSDVSECNVLVPWFCDVSGAAMNGRLPGSAPKWIAGLGYYDAVNHAKRIKAKTNIISALGDYSCAASSQIVLYHCLKAPKTIKMYQGWTHGGRMKKAAVSEMSSPASEKEPDKARDGERNR
ncbi:MAG: acetylxylan esterase [Planctomycetia bacterium]|nr:acetylxylan esterase [Planctomycetia bacterium]